MSSSRRRGRSPGASAQPATPTGAESQGSETPAVESAETGADEGQTFETNESEPATETVLAQQPDGETVSEAEPAAEGAAAEAAPAEEARDEASNPVSEATEAVTAEAVQEAAPVQDIATVEEPAPEAVFTLPEPEAAENIQENVQEAAEETAEAVAQAALLPALEEPMRDASAGRRNSDHLRVGASFGVAPLAPFTEINAKLFAFARGESEAVLAHFQALARAKNPAEAIRLQVTEMQRAADASLTCFSDIVRSANRLGESVRWH